MDVDRRDFLNELAKLAAGAGLVFYGVRVNIGSGEHSDEGGKDSEHPYDWEDHYYGMVVNLSKCIGCCTCMRTCRDENYLGDQGFRTWVERYSIYQDNEVSIDVPFFREKKGEGLRNPLYQLEYPRVGTEKAVRERLQLERGVMIVMHPYITGLVAGAFIISSLHHVFGDEKLAPVAKLSLMKALAFAAFACTPLLLHLGHPERAFSIMIRPNLRSAMSGFGFIHTFYLTLLCVEIWFVFREFIAQRSHDAADAAHILTSNNLVPDRTKDSCAVRSRNPCTLSGRERCSGVGS